MAEPDFIPLDYDTCVGLTKHLATRDDLRLELEEEKQAVIGYDEEDQKAFSLRFPLAFPIPQKGEKLESYAQNLSSQTGNMLLVLVQAGQAALGYSTGGELQHHKVIRKYMVRAEHGKAQLTHLKTKGKSREGSRIRLAQSEQFCREIHEKIREWEVLDECSHILYNCSPRLWSTLLEERFGPSFEAHDPRLMSIPRDIDKPDMDELRRMHNFTRYGRFGIYRESDFKGIEDFLP